MEPVSEPAVAEMSRPVIARTALSHPGRTRCVGCTALSKRVASEQVVRAAGAMVLDRQAEDRAAQHKTVQKLIEALKLQELGPRRRRSGGSKDGTDRPTRLESIVCFGNRQ